jgi:hypothetical protein
MGYSSAFLGNMPAFIKNIFYPLFKLLHPRPLGRGFHLYINWSEVIRKKVEEIIEEEMKRKKGGKDYKRILKASVKSYEIFLKYGGKKSEESIREWRDRN